MKKLLLLSCSLAIFANMGIAQTKQAQNTKAAPIQKQQDVTAMEVQGIPINVFVKGETDQQTKDLGLDAAQSKKMWDVNMNVAIKRSNAEHMTERAKAQQEMAAINKYRAEQYKTVLTAVQYAKWVNTQQGARVSR